MPVLSQTTGPTYLWVLHLWVQPTTDQDTPKGKTHYVVAKVCHVVRSTIVVSLLNVYRLFWGDYSLNNTL